MTDLKKEYGAYKKAIAAQQAKEPSPEPVATETTTPPVKKAPKPRRKGKVKG